MVFRTLEGIHSDSETEREAMEGGGEGGWEGIRGDGKIRKHTRRVDKGVGGVDKRVGGVGSVL